MEILGCVSNTNISFALVVMAMSNFIVHKDYTTQPVRVGLGVAYGFWKEVSQSPGSYTTAWFLPVKY